MLIFSFTGWCRLITCFSTGSIGCQWVGCSVTESSGLNSNSDQDNFKFRLFNDYLPFSFKKKFFKLNVQKVWLAESSGLNSNSDQDDFNEYIFRLFNDYLPFCKF